MRVPIVKIPARIAAKPNPDDWADDALLTIPEAAALMWPDGPITASTLRSAKEEGSLEVREIAGKHFVTKAMLKAMGAPRKTDAPAPAPAEKRGNPAHVGWHVKVGKAPKPGRDAAYDDLMRVLDAAHERLVALRTEAKAAKNAEA